MEKKMAQSVEQIRSLYPDAIVEVWAEDEHRLGLHPVNRMVWTPVGFQPIAQVNWKFEWLWLVGFVHPMSGETYWWIVPLLNWKVFSRLLTDFARHFSLGKHKRIILVVDQPSFHISDKVFIPDGIHLLFLPPKSPELQPAERLWPLTNEAIANRSFASLDELEAVTSHRCQVLLHRRELIQGLTSYHWWMEAIN